MNPNTRYVIDWISRMSKIVNGNWGMRRDLGQDLARAVGELGADDPSNKAVQKARAWEKRILQGERPWEDEDSGVDA